MSARLITWLDRYGSDLSQWPWLAALWARVLMRCSAQARRLWHEAYQQDQQWQQAFHPSELPLALQQRLQRLPQRYPPLAPPPSSLRGLYWLPLGMACSCGLLGLLIGAVFLAPVPSDSVDHLTQASMAVVQLLSQPGAEL